MAHLTIVADDSPLHRSSRRTQLSENGWVLYGEPIEGELMPANSKPPVIAFPPSARRSEPAKPASAPENPPLIVITIHKESRLLQYESLYRTVSTSGQDLAPSLRAAVHQVVPLAVQPQAEVLVSQLSSIEHQSHDYYEIDVPGAIAIAVENYRQRRRHEILAELDEMKIPQSVN